MSKKFGFLGSLFGFLSILLGAFGAHGLKNCLSSQMLTIFQTGVQYQAIHSIILVLIAILNTKTSSIKLISWSGWFFVYGIIIFSGSLYGFALTEIKFLAMITPIGGFSFLLGWTILMISFYKGNINHHI